MWKIRVLGEEVRNEDKRNGKDVVEEEVVPMDNEGFKMVGSRRKWVRK